MILEMQTPRDVPSRQALLQCDIPCVCRVGRLFEVRLEPPFSPAAGVIHGWDRALVEERAPAGQNPMFLVFRRVVSAAVHGPRQGPVHEPVQEGGGLVTIDALDAHEWTADEMAEYMYDFNNIL